MILRTDQLIKDNPAFAGASLAAEGLHDALRKFNSFAGCTGNIARYAALYAEGNRHKAATCTRLAQGLSGLEKTLCLTLAEDYTALAEAWSVCA
jgi:hypothetical protein